MSTAAVCACACVVVCGLHMIHTETAWAQTMPRHCCRQLPGWHAGTHRQHVKPLCVQTGYCAGNAKNAEAKSRLPPGMKHQ